MVSKAISSAVLTAFAVVATVAVVSYQGENTMGYIHESADAVVAEASKPSEKVDVLANLVDLKAYCLAAFDDATYTKSQHPGKEQSILEFVLAYGLHGGEVGANGGKAHVENIVTEYVALMASLKQKWGKGVNDYILEHIDQAVRHDPKGAVFMKHGMTAFGNGGAFGRKFGDLYALRTEALGLDDRPQVTVEMAIPVSRFHQFKQITAAQSENADAVAATIFMKSKAFGRFKSFLQMEIAQVTAKMRSEFGYVAHNAFDAEQKAYKESYESSRQDFFQHVAAQAPAGRLAAKEAAKKSKWVPPTYDQMVKIANEKSKAFLEKFKAAAGGDTSKLIKNMMQQATGIKAFFTTGGASSSSSRMTPKITFVGSKATVDGQIRTVPGEGATFVQHFPAEEDIGELKKIILTATGGNNKWECAGVKARAGGLENPIVHFVKDGKEQPFWLKSGNAIELLPLAKEGATDYDTTRLCVGWKATTGCEKDGSVDAEESLGCDDIIDSSKSGYCDCGNGGKKAKLNCGDASDAFTCTEMCNTA